MEEIEELRGKYADLQEAYTALESEIASLKKNDVAKTEKINELQQLNQKLFLKVSTPLVNNDTPPRTPDDERADIINSFKIKRRN